jgi:hypothetical protein
LLYRGHNHTGVSDDLTTGSLDRENAFCQALSGLSSSSNPKCGFERPAFDCLCNSLDFVARGVRTANADQVHTLRFTVERTISLVQRLDRDMMSVRGHDISLPGFRSDPIYVVQGNRTAGGKCSAERFETIQEWGNG